jgi:DNA-binding NtrC family response regulator
MIPSSALQVETSGVNGPVSHSPAVLIATVDPQLRDGLAELLQQFCLRTIWVKSVADAKHWLAIDNVAVCLCGLWLEGSTCSDLVESLTDPAEEIPVIIATSASAFASEYQHHLAALNIGAFEVICYPCSAGEFQKTLELAMKVHFQSMAHSSTMDLAHASSCRMQGPD